MVVTEIIKDPNSVLDYGFTWADWLNGDTISASIWYIPTGLTLVSDYFTDTDAVVWLSGGTVGSTYTVTNRITTAAGRIEDRSLLIIVKDK
jgi:hypothetical protein